MGVDHNATGNMIQVQRSLAAIETTLVGLAADIAELKKNLREHGDKFDKIDNDKAYAKGVGWVVLGILGAAATFLGAVIIPAIAEWVASHVR